MESVAFLAWLFAVPGLWLSSPQHVNHGDCLPGEHEDRSDLRVSARKQLWRFERKEGGS